MGSNIDFTWKFQDATAICDSRSAQKPASPIQPGYDEVRSPVGTAS